MRTAAFLLLLCMACSSPEKRAGDASNQPPAPSLKTYRAWCINEGKYIGAWELERETAEEFRRRHHRLHPLHFVQIKSRR